MSTDLEAGRFENRRYGQVTHFPVLCLRPVLKGKNRGRSTSGPDQRPALSLPTQSGGHELRFVRASALP
jgi:hypothetical protein